MPSQITRLLLTRRTATFVLGRSLNTVGGASYVGNGSVRLANTGALYYINGVNNNTSSVVSQLQSRTYNSSAAYDIEDTIDVDDYVSPFQDYFDRSSNGITALGTTQRLPRVVAKLDCGISEDDLRFKTTCYGRLFHSPYVQPHEHAVTVKVPWAKIPLDDIEKKILSDIVGSRLNEKKQMLQLTSDQFGSRIENKRHLVSMLNRLVFSARRLAEQVRDEMQLVQEAE